MRIIPSLTTAPSPHQSSALHIFFVSLVSSVVRVSSTSPPDIRICRPRCRRCVNACLLHPPLPLFSFLANHRLKPSPTLNSLRTFLDYRATSPGWVFHLKLLSQSRCRIPMSLLLPSWLRPGSVLSLHRSTLLIGRKNLNSI